MTCHTVACVLPPSTQSFSDHLHCIDSPPTLKWKVTVPNIGALLKQEIVRLARKESRAEVQATKKASAQHRRHIAALRRQVATLERQVALLRRSALDRPPTAAAGLKPLRFVAKGLKSQRSRLGL